MPYEIAERRLQAVAKLLPPPAMIEFVRAANAIDASGEYDHNDCMRAGWAEVNKHWERSPGSKRYMRRKGTRDDRIPVLIGAGEFKMDPTPGDVHVDVPLGSRPPKKRKLKPGEIAKGFATLYVNRPLLNGDAIRAWAAEQGLESALPAGEMHVTIAFSKKEVDWDEFEMQTDELVVPAVEGFEKFSPDQPRDYHGRWSVGGGLVEGTHPGEGYSQDAVLRDGKIYTSNVRDATRALYEKKQVVLDQPREATILIDRLSKVSKRMIALGSKEPKFDLCAVSIRGTNLFCSDSKGIPRVEMPQLGKQTPAFVESLKAEGYTVTDEIERADYLRATQNQLSSASVAHLAARMRSGDFRPGPRIVVSKDNYIVDGHHRWAAIIGLDASDNKLGDLKMDVSRVNIGITDLLKKAHKFSTGGEDIDKAAKRVVHQFPARLTENGATVLLFESEALKKRWAEFKSEGATWDFDDYRPHITITYKATAEQVKDIEPYTGPLVFGPEQFAEVRDDLKGDSGKKVEFEEEPLAKSTAFDNAVASEVQRQMEKAGARHSRVDQDQIQSAHDAIVRAGAVCGGDSTEKSAADVRKDVRVFKLDDEQRMVWGYANIITFKGEPVLDGEDDIIEPETLEKATTEFMKDVRVHGTSHQTAWVIEGDDLVRKVIDVGQVVHSLPFTYALGKLLGHGFEKVEVEGWIVGNYVKDDATWAKYKDGTYKSFSIGGRSEFHPLDAAGALSAA